jgi:hypothetical protein
MGNTFGYQYPHEYPVCEKIHNLFKGPEDYNKNHANSVMIRNGDPEYINVIIKRYGFKDKTDNINAYSHDVLSGWDHWKFPVSKGKAKISIEILKTVDKLYRDQTKCKYVLDFNFFIKQIKNKADMDLDFIETCINILTDVEMFYTEDVLQKQIKNIQIFLKEWKHYSKHYEFHTTAYYKKIIDICNKKSIRLSDLLKKYNKKETNKKNINNDQFDYEYYLEKRRQEDDDEDDLRRRQQEEEEEREREIEREREEYEFFHGDD